MSGVCTTIAAAILATPAWAADTPGTARLNREAKAVFATILKKLARDRDFPLGTCGLAPEWSTYGLGYAIAHKALDLQVHANLESPDFVASPAAEVLGAGVQKDVFCDKEALDRYVQKRIAVWQAAFKALPKGAKPPPGIGLTVRSFSFPFFDRTFRRAVVVWEYDDKSVAFDDKASVVARRSIKAERPSSNTGAPKAGARSARKISTPRTELAGGIDENQIFTVD